MLERLVLVAVGGAFGAAGRYLVSEWMVRLGHESFFPWATLAVNALGSFLLGLLMGAGGEGRWLVPPGMQVLVGVGFLGAFTTFSTFSFETLEAFKLGDPRMAFANVAGNLALALAACWLGLEVGGRV